MESIINEIFTSELINILENRKTKILDIRSVDAYNGWKLHNEKHGGHIISAKSLPAKWIRYIDWIEIVRNKNIIPEDKIVIYGYTKQEAENVAKRFLRSGYDNVSVYNHFINEWSSNNDLPMQKLEHYRHLVPAEWVKNLITTGKADEYENSNYKVIQAHYRNRDAYLSGHIPGAIDMDTLALEDSDTWNRRSPKELKDALEKHGITTNTTVVLYGKFMFPKNDDPFPGSAAGQIAAIRIAFLMMYAGVKDVRVLNGGFQSWKDAGFEISSEDVPKTQVADFGANIPLNPQFAVDTPEAKQMIVSPDAELVCVRSWPEYIGEVSGYNFIEKKGRIPGALFADCGTDAYHMENYRNVDNTTKEFYEIEDNWLKSGITSDKHLAFYCGTGWRGSEAWFNAWLMGWPKVSVYDGGWFEWSNDQDNAFEAGFPGSSVS
jgi:thiosulfate/3-mercaptopyruvate sulfurtransferase